MRKFYIYSAALSILPINVLAAVMFDPIGIRSLPYYVETKKKLELAKNIAKDQCFDADATTPFSSINYSVNNNVREFVSGWGCTNTDGTTNDLVAIYTNTMPNIGSLSSTKIMLVALDQEHNIIDNDAANVATRVITEWCLKLVDNDATDGITPSNDLNYDLDAEVDFTLEEIYGHSLCT